MDHLGLGLRGHVKGLLCLNKGIALEFEIGCCVENRLEGLYEGKWLGGICRSVYREVDGLE